LHQGRLVLRERAHDLELLGVGGLAEQRARRLVRRAWLGSRRRARRRPLDAHHAGERDGQLAVALDVLEHPVESGGEPGGAVAHEQPRVAEHHRLGCRRGVDGGAILLQHAGRSEHRDQPAQKAAGLVGLERVKAAALELAPELVEPLTRQASPREQERRTELGQTIRIDHAELGHVGVEHQVDPLKQDGVIDDALGGAPLEPTVGQHDLDPLALPFDVVVEFVQPLEGAQRPLRRALLGGPLLPVTAPVGEGRGARRIVGEALGREAAPRGLPSALLPHRHAPVRLFPALHEPAGQQLRRRRRPAQPRPPHAQERPGPGRFVLRSRPAGSGQRHQPKLDAGMRGQIPETQLACDLIERRHGRRASFSQGAQERKHLPHPSPLVVIARRGSIAIPASHSGFKRGDYRTSKRPDPASRFVRRSRKFRVRL
jgi:hypothetical protein